MHLDLSCSLQVREHTTNRLIASGEMEKSFPLGAVGGRRGPDAGYNTIIAGQSSRQLAATGGYDDGGERGDHNTGHSATSTSSTPDWTRDLIIRVYGHKLNARVFLDQRPYNIIIEYHALLYIAYVMRIWSAPFPANRWHCRMWP